MFDLLFLHTAKPKKQKQQCDAFVTNVLFLIDFYTTDCKAKGGTMHIGNKYCYFKQYGTWEENYETFKCIGMKMAVVDNYEVNNEILSFAKDGGPTVSLL